MAKDVLITPASGIVEFKDTTVTQASIYESSGSLYLSSNAGSVVFGNGSPGNIELGNTTTYVGLKFVGGGEISSNGGVLDVGASGDTINLNLAGVTYNLPNTLFRVGDSLANLNVSSNVVANVFYSTAAAANGTILAIDTGPVLRRISTNGGLHLGRDDSLYLTGGDVGAGYLQAYFTNSADEKVVIGAEGGVYTFASANNGFGESLAANAIMSWTGFAEGGRLGLGTVYPASTLDVRGTANIAGNTTISGNTVYIGTANSTATTTNTYIQIRSFNGVNEGAALHFAETLDGSGFKVIHDTNNNRLLFQAVVANTESYTPFQIYRDSAVVTFNANVNMLSANVLGTLAVGNTTTNVMSVAANGNMVIGTNAATSTTISTNYQLHFPMVGAQVRIGPSYTDGSGARDYLDLVTGGSTTGLYTNNEIYVIRNYNAAGNTDIITGNTINLTSTNVVISGNLTVSGTTTYINTTNLNVGDNIISLNADLGASAPSENAGISVNRGTSANVAILWDESIDKWVATNDGTTYANIAIGAVGATLSGPTGPYTYYVPMSSSSSGAWTDAIVTDRFVFDKALNALRLGEADGTGMVVMGNSTVNVAISESAIKINGGAGSSGQVLASNGTATAWTSIVGGTTLTTSSGSTPYYLPMANASSGGWSNGYVTTNIYYSAPVGQFVLDGGVKLVVGNTSVNVSVNSSSIAINGGVGTSGQVLTSNGTTTSWATPSGLPTTIKLQNTSGTATATGSNGISLGAGSNGTGADAVAVGTNANTGAAANSIAIGTAANTSGATGAVAIGPNARANNGATVAIGQGAYIDGTGDVAIGGGAAAANQYSTAIGGGAYSYRTGIAVGAFAYSNSIGGIAIGYGTQVTLTAQDSIVIGRSSVATQSYSASLGSNVTTSAVYSMALGADINNSTANSILLGASTWTVRVGGHLQVNATMVANGSTGTAGQVLTSAGSGNVYWATATSGALDPIVAAIALG